jgi:DNA-binding MarR family transcriptional regulator
VSEVTAPGGAASQHDGAKHKGRPGAALLADAPAVDVTRLRVAIARLSRRLRKHELAGLTPTQLAALATVERSGPLRLGDLAAAERIAPSTLTRLVSVLEEHGYVRRCAVPGDARAWTLVVTAQGHEVLDRIRQENTLLLAGSLRKMPAEQVAALAAALPALEQLADGTPEPANPGEPDNPPAGPGPGPGSGPAPAVG